MENSKEIRPKEKRIKPIECKSAVDFFDKAEQLGAEQIVVRVSQKAEHLGGKGMVLSIVDFCNSFEAINVDRKIMAYFTEGYKEGSLIGGDAFDKKKKEKLVWDCAKTAMLRLRLKPDSIPARINTGERTYTEEDFPRLEDTLREKGAETLTSVGFRNLSSF